MFESVLDYLGVFERVSEFRRFSEDALEWGWVCGATNRKLPECLNIETQVSILRLDAQ